MTQKHFLWTIPAPDSSYSALVTHMDEKLEREDNKDPPIQTENFLSGGATTLTFMEEGARVVSSDASLVSIPSYMVVPPDITTLRYNSFLTSISHFMIDEKVRSWIP